MEDLNVIDQFMQAFITYIDSGSSNRPAVKPANQSFTTETVRMPGTGSSTRSMQVDRRRMGSVGETFLCS